MFEQLEVGALASRRIVEAVDKAGGAAAGVLGRMFWWELPESLAISREELLARMREAGIPDVRGPRMLSPVDAFRRATRAAECVRADAASGVERRYRVPRKPTRNDAVLERAVYEEVVDQSQRRLSWREVGRWAFDRRAVDAWVSVSYAQDDFEARMLEGAIARWKRAMTHYESQHLRRLLTGWISALHPVRLRAGVFFVLRAYEADLLPILRFAKAVGGAAEALAVVNGRDERAVVHAAVEQQATEVMEQLRKVLQPERRAKGEVLAALELGRKAVMDLRAYEETLEVNFEQLRWAIETIRRQMRALLDEDAAVPGAA